MYAIPSASSGNGRSFISRDSVKQSGKIVVKLEGAENLINTALCETTIIKNLKDVDLGNPHNQLNM